MGQAGHGFSFVDMGSGRAHDESSSLVVETTPWQGSLVADCIQAPAHPARQLSLVQVPRWQGQGLPRQHLAPVVRRDAPCRKSCEEVCDVEG